MTAWLPTSIPGALRRRIDTFADERGSFREIWRASQTDDFEERMVQANLSRSRAGVLRGMHFHRRQVDVWTVIEGRALAALTDVRPALAGDGGPMTELIELRPGDVLFIPRLVAHGFWALEELALMYLVSNEFDGTDELGFAWDDAQAGIAWPAGEPILSARDQVNPSLATLMDQLSADSR